jgi:hypothetical protein
LVKDSHDAVVHIRIVLFQTWIAEQLHYLLKLKALVSTLDS